MNKQLIYETGRLTTEERAFAEKNKLFIYQLRSADMGGGFVVTNGCWANHEGDWITNFKIELECPDEDCAFLNDDDFYDKYPDADYVSLERLI